MKIKKALYQTAFVKAHEAGGIEPDAPDVQLNLAPREGDSDDAPAILRLTMLNNPALASAFGRGDVVEIEYFIGDE